VVKQFVTLNNPAAPQSAIDALIELFMKNEAIAKIEEGKTDAILDSKKEEIIPKDEQASKTPDEIFNDIVEKCTDFE
jgi:hypothetical protein